MTGNILGRIYSYIRSSIPIPKIMFPRFLPSILATAVFGIAIAPASPVEFIAAVESAHGAAAWPKDKVLSANFSNRSGDKGWEGTFTMNRDMSLVRLDVKDGPAIVFDGKEVWMSPADAKFPKPRFWIFTPPYFALIPFKLRGRGRASRVHRVAVARRSPPRSREAHVCRRHG